MDDVGSFVTGLPKAELHVHLEGTLEAEDLLRFGRRNAVTLPWSDANDVRAAYQFDGLNDFLDLYFHGCAVLRKRVDFYELTLAYLRRAAAQGVRRAEMFFGPQTFLDNHVSMADQLDGVLEAIDDAATDFGIDGALLVSAHRHRSTADALTLLELTEPWADRIGGFGLGGVERGNPPSKFVEYYQACRERGYRTTIHAGEEGPASYVREGLDLCHADRIDHGNAAVSDPELVARLSDAGVPLTMCPLSTLRLKGVANLADHPIRTMMAAGVRVSVNSDDPSYFGGYVGDNMVALHDAAELTREDLLTLARNSFTSAFLDDAAVAAGLSAIDEYERAH
jgi:adenosine deaminase